MCIYISSITSKETMITSWCELRERICSSASDCSTEKTVKKIKKSSLFLYFFTVSKNNIVVYSARKVKPGKSSRRFFHSEFYRLDSKSHLAAQSANSCDWVSFCLPAPARGQKKIRGNILTMSANWA
jgi:hypothetical protein